MSKQAGAIALDWTRVYSSLGLQKETINALQAFRKRNADAKAAHAQVKDQKTDVDFAHYKNIIKNQKIVSELEQSFKSFKPVDYDVAAQLKAIDAFQEKAVTSAQQAAKKVDQELQALQSTLKDIESARPFEDLTTADVARARPEITKAVEEMVKHGKWTTPGYGEKFGNLQAL
ncbi:mitochondrial ATP synthase [Cystobasidium minutum MCA 4210]|uniref:mitochondrial ATP synthase n=1 Tax=Cystobasidium minutum MCA 4210 TaxID=1397322 RepID=UPI0034CF3B1F|eukprot:jgi/Rhomi1/73074/CE73073_20907